MLAGRPREKALLATLFGPGHPILDRTYFDAIGSGRFLEACLKPSGYKFKRGAHEDHSLRALAKPFRSDTEYTRPKHTIAPRDLNHYQFRGIGQTRFKQHPEFCPKCVEEDLERIGFSYWRRSPQVVGSNFCPIHKTGFIDQCVSCGTVNSIHRLPDLQCRKCGVTLFSSNNFEESQKTHIQLAFARAVERIYAGDIAGPLDSARVRDLFNTLKPNPKPPLGAEFSRYIEHTAGEDYLNELGLTYLQSERFAWPTLFYSDAFVIANASHHLLVNAVLSLDDPDVDLWLDQTNSKTGLHFSDDINQGFKCLWQELNAPGRNRRTGA